MINQDLQPVIKLKCNLLGISSLLTYLIFSYIIVNKSSINESSVQYIDSYIENLINPFVKVQNSGTNYSIKNMFFSLKEKFYNRSSASQITQNLISYVDDMQNLDIQLLVQLHKDYSDSKNNVCCIDNKEKFDKSHLIISRNIEDFMFGYGAKESIKEFMCTTYNYTFPSSFLYFVRNKNLDIETIIPNPKTLNYLLHCIHLYQKHRNVYCSIGVKPSDISKYKR